MSCHKIVIYFLALKYKIIINILFSLPVMTKKQFCIPSGTEMYTKKNGNI